MPASSNTPAIVAFDFDGTLTNTDTIKYLVLSLVLATPLRFFSVIYLYYKYRNDMHTMKMSIIGHLINKRHISSVTKSLNVFKWLVKRHIRQDIMSIFHDYSTKKAIVIIATASPSFAVAEIFKNSTTTIIGTDFQIINNRYTGNLENLHCYAENKKVKVNSWLINTATELTYAYSDHYSDIPFLELAQYPVLVYPDEKLRAAAVAMNASIIG